MRGKVQDEGELKEDEGSLKLAAGTKDGHSEASASASARIKRGECGKRERKEGEEEGEERRRVRKRGKKARNEGET